MRIKPRLRRGPIIKNTQSHPRNSGFSSFSLDDRVKRGAEAAGFTEPRPIQAKAIPAVLEGRDVLGLAQTGTGKTAAFALPILSSFLTRKGRGKAPRALILAPTRELASQIEKETALLGRFTSIRTLAVFGGVPINKQVRALRSRPEVLVACPGRLLDLHQRRDVDLRGVEILVLDEADHMFDMGFLPSIRKILAALPERRQNLLFSATMPREIRHLTDRILRQPHVVELNHSSPADTIEHALYPVADPAKLGLLEHLLDEPDFTSAIVFLRTKFRAKRLAERLSRRGRSAVALQGNMSQSQRERAMQGFRDGRFKVLVATDIAARGIDVSGISHVINFDVPNTPDAYTHRIGRTGRSEQPGKACTFITHNDRSQVSAIETRLGTEIPRVRVDGFRDGSNTGDSVDFKRGPRTNGGGGRPGQKRQNGKQTARRHGEGSEDRYDPSQKPARKRTRRAEPAARSFASSRSSNSSASSSRSSNSRGPKSRNSSSSKPDSRARGFSSGPPDGDQGRGGRGNSTASGSRNSSGQRRGRSGHSSDPLVWS